MPTVAQSQKFKKAISQCLETVDLAPPPVEEILTTAASTVTNDISTIPDEVPMQETVGKSCLMNPSGPALWHTAGPLLQEYASNGCLVDTGPNWSQEQIITALTRGPHQSAYANGAPAFLKDETDEKVKQNFAKLV